ncbi:hypothetical protein Nmel_000538 [Mimus melanotis]
MLMDARILRVYIVWTFQIAMGQFTGIFRI